MRAAGSWRAAEAVDRVVLDSGDRARRREGGTAFFLDFPRVVSLRHGDGLVLNDGSIVAVVGTPEALVEVRAAHPAALARLAWHIGNRHIDVQIAGDALRLRRDHVIEAMLAGLGASLSFVDAPFDPEPGAYEGAHGGDAVGDDPIGNGHDG
jgi:urease accessory protein